MSDEALKVVEEIQAALTTEDVVAGLADAERGEMIRATFARLAAPEFPVLMVGPEYTSSQGVGLSGRGPEGFNRVWEEWTSPFDRFRIEIEDMIAAGEKVVSLVAITGRTRTGGVDISQQAAAVWTVRDGKLIEAEFHLDRDRALRAAGIEP